MFSAQDFDKVINQHLYQAKLLTGLMQGEVSKAEQKALFAAIAQASHMAYLALLQRYASDFALAAAARFSSAVELQNQLSELGRVAHELDELVGFEQLEPQQHWLAALLLEYRASSDPQAFLQQLKQRQAEKAQRAQTIAIALDADAQPQLEQEPLALCQAWYQGLSELVQRYRQNAEYY